MSIGGIVKQSLKKNPIDKHVGSRVRMRRMMLGMSQTTLANGLGLTFQQVQKYEKGTNRMGASRLQHIANILQVPVSFFFEGMPDHVSVAPAADYVSAFMVSVDGLALARAFRRIPNAKTRK